MLKLAKQECVTKFTKESNLETLGKTLSHLLHQGVPLAAEKMQTPLRDFSAHMLTQNYLPTKSSMLRNRYVAYRDTHIEVILIAWGKKSETLVHDHAKNGCLMYGLTGLLEEQRYSLSLQRGSSELLTPSTILYIDNHTAYHKIKNLSPKGSLSLHIYSPPLHPTTQWTL